MSLENKVSKYDGVLGKFKLVKDILNGEVEPKELKVISYYTRSNSAIYHTIRTFEKYGEGPEIEKIIKGIEQIARETKDKKATIKVAKLFQEQQIIDVLKIYETSVYTEKITDLILDTFKKTKDKNIPKNIVKTLYTLNNCSDLDDLINTLSNTVRFIDNKNNILKINKLLLNYYQSPNSKLLLAALSNTAIRIKDENTILEVTKTFYKYMDNFSSKYYDFEPVDFLSAISGASEFIKDKETTLEVCKTLQQYMGKKYFSNIATELNTLISNIYDKETILEVCKTLQRYVEKPEAKEVANAISQFAWSGAAKTIVTNRAKTFQKYIDNPMLNDLIPLISDFSDLGKLQGDEVCSNLTLKECNNLYKAQQIVYGIMRNKSNEIKKQAIEGFYTSLNNHISKGKTVQEKLKIINSWSNKIYNSILQNPDGFTYVVAK
ncbi:MAG: hypothetical protein AB7V77_01115 [Candidatus Woesearchaeota archaeon]